MWNTFVFQDKYYLFQLLNSNEEVTISMTNLQTIWCVTTSLNNILSTFQELNPLLSQEAEALQKTCLATINEEFINSLILEDIDQSCQIQFKHFLEELPLRMEVKLTKQIGDQFLQKITIPMVQTVQYLELKQQKLESLLQQKDKELLEYKHEYGNISRKLLDTAKYETDTEAKTSLLLNIFTQNGNFNTIFATQNGDVQQLFPELKVEPKREKRKLELAPTKYKKRNV